MCVCMCGVAATPEFHSSFQPLENRCLQTGVAAVSTPYALKYDVGVKQKGKEGLPIQAK